MDSKSKYLLIAAAVLLFLQLLALLYCCFRIASLKRQVASLEVCANQIEDRPGVKAFFLEGQIGVEGEEKEVGASALEDEDRYQRRNRSIFLNAAMFPHERNERRNAGVFLDREQSPSQAETSIRTVSALQKYCAPGGKTRLGLEGNVILHFINPYDFKEGIPEGLYSVDRENVFRLFDYHLEDGPNSGRFVKVQHLVERASASSAQYVPVTVIYMWGPHQLHTLETDSMTMHAKLALIYRDVLYAAARDRAFHPGASEGPAYVLHLPVVLCNLRKNHISIAAEILSELLLCDPDTGKPDPDLLKDLGILNLEFVLPESYKVSHFFECLKYYAIRKNSDAVRVCYDMTEREMRPVDRSFCNYLQSIIAQRNPLSDGCPCTPESEWGGNWPPLAEGLLDVAPVLDDAVLEAQERDDPATAK